jgi:hypothetical protein
MSHSYSSQRDKNLSKLTGPAATSNRFDDRNLESPAALANQVLLLASQLLCFICQHIVVEFKSL